MMLVDEYLSTMEPMRAGRVGKALVKFQGFSGTVMRRHEWAEQNWNRVRVEKHMIMRTDGSNTGYLIKDVTKAVADYVQWIQDIYNRGMEHDD